MKKKNRYKVLIVSDNDSSFKYSQKDRRYSDGEGPILATKIRHELDSIIDKSIYSLRTYTNDLKNGDMTLSGWQEAMASEIKNLHVSFTAAARGGWNNVTSNDWNRVSLTIAQEYSYLQRFANQIYTGEQPANNTMTNRATLYGESARITYENERRILESNSGASEERNILGGTDHCNGCVDATLIGWVEIGSLVPIGNRECQARCRCIMIYRTLPGYNNGAYDEEEE